MALIKIPGAKSYSKGQDKYTLHRSSSSLEIGNKETNPKKQQITKKKKPTTIIQNKNNKKSL